MKILLKHITHTHLHTHITFITEYINDLIDVNHMESNLNLCFLDLMLG